MHTLPPLSLYIHIPWCVRKCPYCDFNSHARQGELPEFAYVDAMLEDLDQDLGFVQGRSIHSIFIGGGTPSLFSAAAYSRLFAGLRARLGFAADIEITLEANPGTLEVGRFAAYRTLGINRLSIGVQSFDPEQLKKLGRIHSDSDALAAIHSARQADFDNFNIDLMHGLSGQTAAQALADLTTAIDAGAPHISWYQLTIEPNTEFYKRPPQLPVESELGAIQQEGHELLAESGFGRYEVSAYARQGHRAKHNLNYWCFGDYLAIGAGAHGKITVADSREVFRYQKTRKPEDYLSRIGSRTSKREMIAREELPLEFMMNALRLREGVDEALFFQRTGVPLGDINNSLEQLRANGLLVRRKGTIAATDKGFEFLDSVLAEFL
ncbi:radical SAM family heme chaperone HemW [Spongiibacter sp. KMU-166]|uniref:Heme chaperone HemW n=1 Tax=Spongiibacter thalassae TaxID=2721624 RepID=A0ABX1GHG0_9GAMM|nr:radical SAM family heme chaperone HemW [Spongiibacter thalassae]NKI18386.1 radical SAM family heme chaperone HemW [Spongiibacter thalassae]